MHDDIVDITPDAKATPPKPPRPQTKPKAPAAPPKTIAAPRAAAIAMSGFLSAWEAKTPPTEQTIRIAEALTQGNRLGAISKLMERLLARDAEEPPSANDIARLVAKDAQGKKPLKPAEKERLAATIRELASLGRSQFAKDLTRNLSAILPAGAEKLLEGRQAAEARKWTEAFNLLRQIPENGQDYEAALLLGDAAARCGNPDTARTAFARAASKRPGDGFTLAKWGAGEIACGDLDTGFRLYEARETIPAPPHKPPSNARTWNGITIPGQTLLLHDTGGVGEAVWMLRYLKRVRRRAGDDADIVLACRPSMAPLIAFHPHLSRSAPLNEGEAPPNHDLRLALSSLPFAVDRDLSKADAETPWIHAKPAQIPHTENDTQRINVGLAWDPAGGSPVGLRSSFLAPFAAVADRVRFFALRYEPAENQTIAETSTLSFIDQTFSNAPPDSLKEVASHIAAMDAVVAADGAIAHLAGAMFKPALMLLPEDQRLDWKWRSNRFRPEWYPAAIPLRVDDDNLEPDARWRILIDKALDLVVDGRLRTLTRRA